MINSHLMLGDISGAKRFFPPFHFDKIHIAVNFNYTVYLSDNSFAVIATNSKCFANQNAAFFEKAIQNRFEFFSTLMRIIRSHKRK